MLPRWSIRRRILLVGAIPVVLSVLLLTIFHTANRWQDVRSENQTIARILLEQMSAAAEYPLLSGNYELLTPLVDTALTQPAIVALRIVDAQGQEVLYRQADTFGELPDDDIRWLKSDMVRPLPLLDEFAEFADPQVQEQHLGRIELGMSDAFTRERERSIQLQSLLAGVLAMLAAAAIGHATSRSIIPPLETLTRFITRLTQGPVRERLPVSQGSEIGQLQLSANRLAESLEQARKDHEHYTRELLREQQKTQQASRAKSEFLAMMSHELRTPLNGAIGMLQLLDRSNSEAEFDDYKRTADRSLTHLTQLLEDVLVVIDTEKNRLPVMTEEQSVPQVLSNLVEDFVQRAMERSLSLVVDYDERVQRELLSFDPSLLRQLIRHLLDNALKFTDEGLVTLQLQHQHREAQDWLVIRVTDTGIGIADDQKQRVLEAFAQVDSSFNRRHEGIGLGLTICHHITRTLGGHLRLEDNPGGGTCVTVEYPLPAGDMERPVPAEKASVRHVLLVDDNPVNTLVAEKMLKKVWPHLQLTAVGSGAACLQQVAEQPVDLILMDCQMPGMDGPETSRRLRAQGIVTPIVACTANMTEQAFNECLAAGMNDYLAKPLKPEMIRSVLEKWL